MDKPPFYVAIAILIFCIWDASGITAGWVLAPYESFAWVAFIIWIFPLIYAWLIIPNRKFPKFQTASFLFLALFFAIVGMMASLNILQHLSLAFAIGAFIPWSRGMLLWMLGAVSWIPAFGYFLSDHSVVAVASLRIAIAFLSTAWELYLLKPKAGNE